MEGGEGGQQRLGMFFLLLLYVFGHSYTMQASYARLCASRATRADFKLENSDGLGRLMQPHIHFKPI